MPSTDSFDPEVFRKQLMEDVQAAMKDSMAQTLALMQTQMLPMVQTVTEEQ